MNYKCEVCGATKEVEKGAEVPVCCDKPMTLCKEEEGSSCCSCCG